MDAEQVNVMSSDSTALIALAGCVMISVIEISVYQFISLPILATYLKQ